MKCPECGETLDEVWASYQDTSDEYGESHEGLAGYECKKCGIKYDINGEEM